MVNRIKDAIILSIVGYATHKVLDHFFNAKKKEPEKKPCTKAFCKSN